MNISRVAPGSADTRAATGLVALMTTAQTFRSPSLILLWAAGAYLNVHLAAAPGDLKWRLPLPISWVASQPAMAEDGTVYVLTFEGLVVAADGKTGQKKWEFATGVMGTTPPPTIAADGTVYVGLSNGRVDALDGATGQRKWSYASGDSTYPGVFSPSISMDGTLYVTSDGMSLHALDPRTGQRKWRLSLISTPGEWTCSGCAFAATPAIAADGTLFLASKDGRFRAFDGANGQQKWEVAMATESFTSAAMGLDGTLYFGSNDGFLNALDSVTGQQKWQFEGGGCANPSIGPDGTVYAGGGDHKLYALDGVTGQKKWEFLTENLVSSTPAIGSDGTLYFGSGRKFYALDSTTGHKKWEFQGMDTLGSSPALGHDGTVYFSAQAEGLCALETSSVEGLAQSAWPKYRGNSQNTGQQAPVAPTVVRRLGSKVGLEGQPALLTAQIIGAPLPAYQWFFNDHPIPGATGKMYTVSSLSTAHEGKYALVASNVLGTITTGPATLLVNNVAPSHFPVLFFSGTVGGQVSLQFADRLEPPASWQDLAAFTLEPPRSVFVDLTATNVPQRFYRAPGAEPLEFWSLPGWPLTGSVGSQYQIHKVDLTSALPEWTQLTTLTLPSSPYLFIDLTATNGSLRHYRTTPAP